MNSPQQILLAIVLACAASLPVYADCLLPPAPNKIPDGSTANQQEMITAMQTLKEYNNDVDIYTKCLEFEARQNRLSRSDLEKMQNNAVETLQKVAAKFNEQVRTFKAKNG
jgi:hypothetical protein